MVCVTVLALLVALMVVVTVPAGRYERVRELSRDWCAALRS